MSSISKAGIFIDLKQLLPFTDQMNKAMTHADRDDYGSKLIQGNLDMISYFALAYHRRDENVEFEVGGRKYAIKLLDSITRKGIIKDYKELKIS